MCNEWSKCINLDFIILVKYDTRSCFGVLYKLTIVAILALLVTWAKEIQNMANNFSCNVCSQAMNFSRF